MKETVDFMLKNWLRRWASRPRPDANGRARLLRAAAQAVSGARVEYRYNLNLPNAYRPTALNYITTSWNLIQPVQASLATGGRIIL